MKHFNLTLGLVAAAALAAPLSAQGRNSVGVPPGQMPPAGMCRIWIDGVPPGRQPRPTDCVTAERNVPYNGRVIYGSNTANGGKYGRNGNVYGNNNGVYDRNGDGVIDRRDQVGTDCHWYDLNCTSASAASEGWVVVGRDRNGNTIYERRRTTRQGDVVVQRARRDSNGRFVIISKNSVNGDQRRVIQRNGQVDRDYNNDGIDDRYENGKGKYKDKGSKKH